jgi:hypothetical protein
MRINRLFAGLLVALVLSTFGAIAPQPAAAAADSPVTVFFTATVDEVRDAYSVLNVKPGDTITGTYTYNAAAPNSPREYSNNSYIHTTAPYGIHLSVGNMVLETNPQNVYFSMYLANNVNGRDSSVLGSINNRPIPGLWDITEISWSLYDPTMTALKNTNFSRTAPTLSDWRQDAGWGLRVRGADLVPNSEHNLLLQAHVTSVRKI